MAEALNSTGRFCWYDLMSTDVDRSLDFYSKLFGWSHQVQDMGEMGTYTMLLNGDAGIGGAAKIPQPGVPTHWAGYVTVADVDETLSKAKEAGGQVVVPGTDIPDTGRFGIMLDPTGAPIAAFKGLREMPEPEGGEPHGSPCWNELLAKNVDEAATFYTHIFDWSVGEMDMGPDGTYFLFKTGELMRAGMMLMPPDAQGPQAWLTYFASDDVDASAATARQHGGQVFLEPKDIPGVGRIAVCADSLGGLFGLYKMIQSG